MQTLAAGQAIVPVLWRYEVSAVLAKAQKDGILTDLKVSALLTLQSLNIQLDREGADYILSDAHRLAVAHRLTSYDAAYLELAMRKKLPLATLDDELIRACNRTGHALL
ncbi:MAG TPA: type II toxin-antitoxin system VapC family toxin [Bryobacteraceae bacterium]|nr:type II toxin-antitoxin system VapC family toxin [Bryobacteraceae bacterium]